MPRTQVAGLGGIGGAWACCDVLFGNADDNEAGELGSGSPCGLLIGGSPEGAAGVVVFGTATLSKLGDDDPVFADFPTGGKAEGDDEAGAGSLSLEEPALFGTSTNPLPRALQCGHE